MAGPDENSGVRPRGPAGGSGSETFSEFTYIYRNLSRHPVRYVMTVSALALCVVFFIVIASLAVGLQEELEGGLEPDEPTPDVSETPSDEGGPKSAELVSLEENVKGTVLTWLYLMAVLLFLTSGTSVAMTMHNNVKRREKEIGILKAVGLRDRDVQRLFMYEALWLCGAAFVIGALIGSTLSANVFDPQYESGAGGLFFSPARTTPVILLAALILTFTTGLAATWDPARRASLLDPVKAMAT